MKSFDKYLKENYNYKITKAEIDPKEEILNVYVRANFVLPIEALEEAEQELLPEMPEIKAVKFDFDYEYMIPKREEILREYIPYLFKEAGDCASLFNGVTGEDIVIRGRDVEISVLGEQTAKRLGDYLKADFEKTIEEKFGIKTTVSFIDDKGKSKELSERKEEKIKDAASAVPPQYAQKKDKARKTPRDTLLGKPVSGPFTHIADLNEDSGMVNITGDVFAVDSRVTSTGKVLLTFGIYDGEQSMPVKVFLKEDRWNEIKDDFQDDIRIKLRGKAGWDDYMHTLSVSAQGIEKTEKILREDKAEEKRVELHAHTKMSAMDGLSDPKELIRLAARFGHKAVAVTDHGVVQAFPYAASEAKNNDIKVIYGCEGYIYDDEGGTVSHKDARSYHIILLAKNKAGIRSLYELVSLSHLEHFYYWPRMPKSLVEKYRKDLILGSACVVGEVFQSVVNRLPEEKQREIARFYDYLEIQPLVNNSFLIRSENYDYITEEKDLENLNRRVLSLGEEIQKPVVATCDAHYLEENDALYRRVMQAGQGYKDVDEGQGLYFRTTEEMLEEFSYLDEDTRRRVVIDNPNMIADMIEDTSPIADGKFPPKIEHADEILRNTCERTARETYGDPLPGPIRERLDKELNSIIGNGYAVMYISAKMLVDKSMSDGYLVGSRGSVGSSFAATMSGITEVNPLKPHYICPSCKHLEWGDDSIYECGVDMPAKNCPVCGAPMNQDGHSIPFETFLGFEGDKEPDIDLNFAGEYQQYAHKYVEEIFGKENVFKAGTIGTIALKTAVNFAKKYFEERGISASKLEIERIADHCVGVKRTTGQHPGGIVILPEDHEITEFCPVQRPANDTKSEITTTHFDYHSIDENLLKLDILGHDTPSMIRQLKDITGIDPQTVPLKDDKVNSIFNGCEALDIKADDYKFKHGSYGIPEFGTRFVRQMLDDTHPETFADFVRISGFSHGTNVWTNNAQKFIRSGEATIKNAISTRDDIMNYLIAKGMPNADAFKIMESVRKGRGLTGDQEADMREKDVPAWYIESCKRISYMFPRAHAVAYVMMSYRIAYFKVYHPEAFYAACFTTRVADFNWSVISRGRKAVEEAMARINLKGTQATEKENGENIVFELAYEMFSRGYEFKPPKLDARALQFWTEDGKIVVPLCALEGVGETCGRMIESEQRAHPFETVEDLKTRAKVNKTAIESLTEAGVLEGLPESDQMSLFAM